MIRRRRVLLLAWMFLVLGAGAGVAFWIRAHRAPYFGPGPELTADQRLEGAPAYCARYSSGIWRCSGRTQPYYLIMPPANLTDYPSKVVDLNGAVLATCGGWYMSTACEDYVHDFPQTHSECAEVSGDCPGISRTQYSFP